MLSYQKLDVYQCAIEFLAVAAEIERVVSMLTKMIKF